jgi:nicotinamidase-related amidase
MEIHPKLWSATPVAKEEKMRKVTFLLVLLVLAWTNVRAESIDLLWDKVVPPEKPELHPVTIAPGTTAFLVLDIEERTCNRERRPRCLDTLEPIAKLLEAARKAGVRVVHSLTTQGTPETILPPAAPLPGEPVVSSSVDKFWRTDLEKILAERGVETVIVTGTAAHGAVLNTATAAGFRGMQIILPLDCLSAEDLYTEQASVHLLMTGPATRGKITVTRSGMIFFGK